MPSPKPFQLEPLTTDISRTPFQNMRRRLLRHRSARMGMLVLGILTLAAILAPLIAPYDPIKPLRDTKRRSPPCIHILGCPEDQSQHIFGTDGNQRDLFSRVVYGARLSLSIGVATVTFAIVIGVVLGALAGYSGGWLDNSIMRVMDVLLAFPSLISHRDRCRSRSRPSQRLACNLLCIHPGLCAVSARQCSAGERAGFRLCFACAGSFSNRHLE